MKRAAAKKDSAPKGGDRYPLLARASAASVEKHTGRRWDAWVALLDEAGGRNWDYQALTTFIRRKKKMNPYWQGIVAQGYEMAIGRRVEGRNAKGLYTVTVTGTIGLNVRKLWQLITGEDGQALWLRPLSPVNFIAKESYEAEGGVFGEIRTVNPPDRIRLRYQETEWDKPTVLQVYLAARPGEKALLVLMHEGIPNARLRESLRSQWREAISRLQEAAKIAEVPVKKRRSEPGKPARPRRKRLS